MIFAMPLRHIINCSLISGIVPSKHKLAKATPIFQNNHHDHMHINIPMSMLH